MSREKMKKLKVGDLIMHCTPKWNYIAKVIKVERPKPQGQTVKFTWMDEAP